jgi:hypothetical protein
MSRVNGSALMFDEDEVKATTEMLPRLIRVVFYGLSVSNDSYLDQYYHYFRDLFPDKTRKEFIQKAAADRKFLLDRRKLTFNMMRNVLAAMGYDIESVSIKVRDRLTGDEKTFSTDDTVEKLKEMVERDKVVGVQSIV